MLSRLKAIWALFFVAHPLERFEPYVESKGSLADYLKHFGLVRGGKNYFNCRIRRSGIVSVFYNQQAQCLIRSGSADVMVFEQIFLFNDYAITFKKTPKTIIDAGAHVGLAALYFSGQYPDAKIISLEPQVDNFNLLRRNVEKQSNVQALQAALWHETGSIYIEDSNATSWAFRVTDDYSQTVVDAISVETIVSENDWEEIDVLKVDIEGAEKPVFEQKPQWVNQVNYLVIETHDHIQSGASKAVEDAVIDDMQLMQHQGENWVFESRQFSGSTKT